MSQPIGLKEPPPPLGMSSSGPGGGPPIDDVYIPRRSALVPSDMMLMTMSDGDTWQERLAICESVTDEGNPKLLIRSYYRNNRTQERVWDEPPSGAGIVKHATADNRKAMDLQMQELSLTLEMIPKEETQGVALASASKTQNGNNRKTTGFFGRFRKKKEKPMVDDAHDLNLQRAIARSMAEQHGGGGADDPVIFYDPDSAIACRYDNNDDDDMAMAKALSLSESAAPHHASSSSKPSSSNTMSEEEMLQRALEESRRESEQSGANGVASLPVPMIDYIPASPSPQPAQRKKVPPIASSLVSPPFDLNDVDGGDNDDNDNGVTNSKMPAKRKPGDAAHKMPATTALPPSSSSSSPSFDPYAPATTKGSQNNDNNSNTGTPLGTASFEEDFLLLDHAAAATTTTPPEPEPRQKVSSGGGRGGGIGRFFGGGISQRKQQQQQQDGGNATGLA